MSLPSASEALQPAVEVNDLSVRYRTNFEKTPTLKAFLARPGRPRGVRVIEALNGVSFTVPSGFVLGVIGPTALAKSTLPCAIAGILPPSTGRIVVRGQVSTLLALGVGFNKTLSGRENIALGGLAAGLEPEQIEVASPTSLSSPTLGSSSTSNENLLVGHVWASCLRRRRPHGSRRPLDRRGAGHRRCRLPGDVHPQDAGPLRQRRHHPPRLARLGHLREMADEYLWLDKGQIRGRGKPVDVIGQYKTYMRVVQTVGASERRSVRKETWCSASTHARMWR